MADAGRYFENNMSPMNNRPNPISGGLVVTMLGLGLIAVVLVRRVWWGGGAQAVVAPGVVGPAVGRPVNMDMNAPDEDVSDDEAGGLETPPTSDTD